MVLGAEWLPAWATWHQRPFPAAAFATALGRPQRLVDDPAGAV
jgi:hypothetical protein